MSDNRPRVVTVSSFRSPWTTCEKATSKQLLEQAEELFQLGYVRASGMLARVAIETGLLDVLKARNQFVVHPINGRQIKDYEPTGRTKLVIATLECARSIDADFRQQIDLAMHTGNRAAHGQSVAPSEVMYAIEVAREVLRKACKAQNDARERLQSAMALKAARHAAEMAEAIDAGDAMLKAA